MEQARQEIRLKDGTPWGLLLVLATVLGSLLARPFSHPSYTDIHGHVYERFDVAPAGQVRPVNPISGAKVSNNRDSTTATTDDSGYFHLQVRPSLAADEFVTLFVRTGSMVVCHKGGQFGQITNIFLEGGPRQFANVRCGDNATPK